MHPRRRNGLAPYLLADFGREAVERQKRSVFVGDLEFDGVGAHVVEQSRGREFAAQDDVGGRLPKPAFDAKTQIIGE